MLTIIGLNYKIEKKVNSKKNLSFLAYRNSVDLKIHYIENNKSALFFGYHDKTPFNKSGTRILANAVAADDSKYESEGSPMELGFYEWKISRLNRGHFHKFSETTTWSWQQGCMLQWNPNQPESEVIFNKMIEGSYGAVIVDVETGEEKKYYKKPIYCVDPTGKYAASLNFSRIARIRKGYGYRNLPDEFSHSKAHYDDGIHLIDLSSGQSEMIISLGKLAELTLQEKDHYINHITFSPDGKYLTFFHFYSNVGVKKINKFYLYDIENKRLQLIEGFRTVSHYCWRNNDELITTENGPTGYQYFIYNFRLKTKKRLDIPNIGDFHPMVHPNDSNIIVADSKPDIRRNQHLFLFNISTGDCKCIGSFYSPKRYSQEVRCDLHPRWDKRGEAVVIDTTSKGKRALAVVEIPSDIWS